MVIDEAAVEAALESFPSTEDDPEVDEDPEDDDDADDVNAVAAAVVAADDTAEANNGETGACTPSCSGVDAEPGDPRLALEEDK